MNPTHTSIDAVPLELPTNDRAVRHIRNSMPVNNEQPSYWAQRAPQGPSAANVDAIVGEDYEMETRPRLLDRLRGRPRPRPPAAARPTSQQPEQPVGSGDVTVPRASDLPPLPPSAQPPAGATVAKSLSDIRWVDSKVYPPGAAPEIQNIQQIGPAMFSCILRHRGSWHDGDRHLTTGKYATKSRAEMCCLGGNTPYTLGSTWLIGTTVRLNPDFVPSAGYCNIMQPVLHQSYFTMHDLKGDIVTGSLRVFTAGLGSSSRTVRTVQFKRGEWVSLVLKVTFGANGYYGLSVNGDEFQGFNLDTTIGHIKGSKVGKVSSFGGTWGLYMSTNPLRGQALKDAVVTHANIFIKKV